MRDDEGTVKQGFWVATAAFMALVYSLVVRDLRTEHKNAALGIILSVAQPLAVGLVFYGFMMLIGGRGGQIRGDDMTFILIGFILFFMHVRTLAAVAGSLKQDMMNHQRVTPFLMICVKAISAAYKNVLAFIIMLILNYLLRGVFEMQDALLFLVVMFWCWLFGIAAGVVLLAANRYLTWGSILQTTYVRIMFFTSGKFFVANAMPGVMRPFMDWNPLFHLLDQGRSAAFLNYTARTTEMSYPMTVIMALLIVAMLVEHYVRVNYSASHSPS